MASTHAKTPAYVPEVRTAARQAFIERYPDVSFAPIVAVIAAYNEEESLGEVLRAMPAEGADLRVDTIVVNDGSTDGTERVALDHPGVYVVSLGRNCGQGVALRLGYHAALVPNEVTAADFEELQRHFDEGQIVEIVGTIALFGYLNRWNDTMATQLETKAVDVANRAIGAVGWTPGKHLPSA